MAFTETEKRKAFAAGFIRAQFEACKYELDLKPSEVIDACIKILRDQPVFNKNYKIVPLNPCCNCPFKEE